MSNQSPRETSHEIMMQPQPNPSSSEQNQYALQPNQHPIQLSKVYPQPAPNSDQPALRSDQHAPNPENQIQYAQYPQPLIEYPNFYCKNEPIYVTCKACHKSGNTSIRSRLSFVQWVF